MYSARSLRTLDSIPTRALETSRAAGWTSLLVERHLAAACGDEFETECTPDITITVALTGHHELEAFVDGRWHRGRYGPGSVGLTAPSERDRLRWNASTAIQVAYVFLPALVLSEAAEALRCSVRRAPSALVFDDPIIATTVDGLLAAMRSGVNDTYAQQATQWLAMHLLVSHGSVDARRFESSRERLNHVGLTRTIAFIRSHFAERMPLDRLAAEAGVSKFYFARLFRDRTGTSPHAFVTDVRLGAARRLLTTGDMAIAEVGRSTGYPDASQFSVAFARRYGTTPSAFRKLRDGVGSLRLESDADDA